MWSAFNDEKTLEEWLLGEVELWFICRFEICVLRSWWHTQMHGWTRVLKSQSNTIAVAFLKCVFLLHISPFALICPVWASFKLSDVSRLRRRRSWRSSCRAGVRWSWPETASYAGRSPGSPQHWWVPPQCFSCECLSASHARTYLTWHTLVPPLSSTLCFRCG